MRMFPRTKNQKGFTLLEVLLVVAIIAILIGIVIIAINPSRQQVDTRNAQREADVTTILNAIEKYSMDNNGALPSSITTATTEICANDASSCAGLVNLDTLVDNGYLDTLPEDPQCSTACATNGTGYTVSKTSDNVVTVDAPSAEQGRVISASS